MKPIIDQSLKNIADAVNGKYLKVDKDGLYYSVPNNIRRSGKYRVRPTQIIAAMKNKLITWEQHEEIIKMLVQ